MTPRGGARKGAGRPPRIGPRSTPIWCGQLTPVERALIVETLTPQERYEALMDAVWVKLDVTRKAHGRDGVVWGTMPGNNPWRG